MCPAIVFVESRRTGRLQRSPETAPRATREMEARPPLHNWMLRGAWRPALAGACTSAIPAITRSERSLQTAPSPRSQGLACQVPWGMEDLLLARSSMCRWFLVSRGKQLAIANFLGPDEKASFAQALGNALSEAKRGVTRTTFG